MGTQTYWDPLWTTSGQGGFRTGFHTATIQIHGLLILLDVDGLGCSSLPVASHSIPLHSGTIPANCVV